ncbi:MAG: SLATT domain-containing protein [Candidatus Korobacteraceae bacterium]|jgi:conflict system pore-forming effector with SLATT domain
MSTNSQRKSHDIKTDRQSIAWDPNNVPGSLSAIREYVEAEAVKAIDWYFASKKWKSICSRWLRASAILLSTAAGIVPLAIVLILKKDNISTGLWVSLLLGLAAGIVGIDHFFGLSSGWVRYVITATGIQSALEDFRMDWNMLSAHLSAPPTNEQILALIDRAKSFRSSVAGMVLDETKAWAAEFQSSMAQLEKDVKTSFEEQRAKAEQEFKARNLAVRPGAIELKVSNALTADDRRFTVTLEGAPPPIPAETVEGAVEWSRASIPPGQYRLLVTALKGGKSVRASKIVKVGPDAVANAEIELPNITT